MDELSSFLFRFLFDWSIRFGILILGLMIWFWFRPPASVYSRLFLGHLVLFAGLAFPLTPKWWGTPWESLDRLFPSKPQTESLSLVDPSIPELIARNSAASQVSIPPKALGNPRTETTPTGLLPAQGMVTPEPVLPEAPSMETRAHWTVSWASVLTGAWTLGVCFFLVRIGAGIWWLRSIRNTAKDAPQNLVHEWSETGRSIGIGRKVPLKISPFVQTPTFLGGFQPMVLIPSVWMESSVEDRRAAFLHEWTHIGHWDDWAKWTEEMVRAVFFFHPLVHWLLNRIDRDREQRCDAAAIQGGVPPRQLAELLLRQSQQIPTGQNTFCFAPAISFFQPHSVKERIHTLLEVDMNQWMKPLSWFRIGLIALLVATISLVVGSHGLATTRETTEALSSNNLAPTGEDPDAVKVTGTVTLENGQPAGEAIVWASLLEVGLPVRRETRTDLLGKYQLRLPPGVWLVSARKGSQGGEGLNSKSQPDQEITKGSPPRTVPIRMKERGYFRGQLLEQETGKPIAQGKLFLNNGAILITDENGKWELGGLERTNHEGFVVANGRQRLRVLFDTTQNRETYLELRVPKGALIQGRVTDLQGKPIPQASVGRSTSGGILSLNGVYESCDQEGKFAYWDAVPAGQPTRLKASAMGYQSVDEDGFQVEPGKTFSIRFELPKDPGKDSVEAGPGEKKKRVVSGTVVGPDEKPIANASVSWGEEQNTNAPTATTDKDGLFKMVVPDEERTLMILATNFQPQYLPIPKGADHQVKVELLTGTTVGGTVVDDKGKPIEGVMVIPALMDKPNPIWLDTHASFTTADGKFAITGIPLGATLDFLKIGLSDLRNQTLAFNKTDHRVKMVHGGAIKGKVIGPDGKPIRNFRITVNEPRSSKPEDKMTGFFAGYSGMGIHFTSEDGTFVLTGIAAGDTLRIQAHANGLGEAVVDRVMAVPTNHLEQTKTTVLKAAAPTPITIQVKDDSGQPIPGAKITLVDGPATLDKNFSWGYHNATWDDMTRTQTDGRGMAHFPSVSFTEGVILVEAPGYARKRIPWRKKESQFTVKMKKEAVLAGTIPPNAANPNESYQVQLLSEAGDMITLKVPQRNQGIFTIQELPAGTWSLAISPVSGNGAGINGTVELKVGEKKGWSR